MWAFKSLGSKVRLLEDWDVHDDGSCIKPAGQVGILDGIIRIHPQVVRALVVFPDDLSCAVDIPFGILGPG